MIWEAFKEICGWLVVALMFAFILAVCLSGGGVLDPMFWSIVLSK